MQLLRIAHIVALAVVVTAAHAEPVRVFVGIAPHKHLVESIGGEHVSVSCIVDEGQSPHTFQVRPRQLGDLSRARVYFRSWLEFEEGLLRRIEQNYPEIAIVPLTVAEHGVLDDHHHHDDDPGHVHDHTCGLGGFDPHTWLHPGHLNLQAEIVRDTLSAIRPELAELFAENYAAFRDDLAAVHMELKDLLEPVAGRTFYVYHPAFAYFAQAYGLEQVGIEQEGKGPGARRLYGIIEAMKAQGVGTLFVQPQYSTQEARAIAQETGAAIETLDPLSENVLANLLVIGRSIRAALDGDAG
jgi:zinc transport system substrate-binding protein